MNSLDEITKLVREMCKKKIAIKPGKSVSAQETDAKPYESKWIQDMFEDSKPELTEYLWRIRKL